MQNQTHESTATATAPATPAPVAAPAPAPASTSKPAGEKPKPKAPAKRTRKAPAKGKGTGTKRTRKAGKVAVPPHKWAPGGKQKAIFKAMCTAKGCTGPQANKLYWPKGGQSAGWRCVLDHEPYMWGKHSGRHGYVGRVPNPKGKGTVACYWLVKPGTTPPKGATKVYTYKAPKAAQAAA